MHIEKYKNASACAILGHIKREHEHYKNENVDLSKSDQNIYFVNRDLKYYEDRIKNLYVYGGWNDKNKLKYNSLCSIVVHCPKNFEDKNKFFEMGKNYNGGKTPFEAFTFITSKFLDGMPCDHALAILKNDKDELVFTVTRDVHENIWKNYVDPQNHWILRDNFIAGSLESSNIKFEKIDEKYILRK